MRAHLLSFCLLAVLATACAEGAEAPALTSQHAPLAGAGAGLVEPGDAPTDATRLTATGLVAAAIKAEHDAAGGAASYFYARGARQSLTVWPGVFVLNLPRDATAKSTVQHASWLRRLADAGLTAQSTLADAHSTIAIISAPRAALEAALGPELTAYVQPLYRDGSQQAVVPSDRIIVRFADDLASPSVDPASVVARALGGVPLEQLRDRSWIIRVAGNAIGAANRVQESGLAVFAEPDLGRTYEVRWVPNDPYYELQWHLESRGGRAAREGADINAEAAWDITHGSPETIIAIIDTGVDPNHEDLDSCKLLEGYNAVLDAVGADDTGDHGTACAGVAAARGNNGIGVIGACPSCRVLPIRIGLGSDSGDLAARLVPGFDRLAFDSHIARAFFQAVDRGAAVISNSWGPTLTSGPRMLSSIGAAALDSALTDGRAGKGAVVLFAAGNEAGPTELDGWAIHPGVMAIAATNDQDVRSSYSNFGAPISVAAPSSGLHRVDGALTSGIWTTDRSGPKGYNAGIGLRTAGDSRGNYTSRFGGTSSSAPLTAGVAGLVLSVDASLTGLEVRAILEDTAAKIDPEGGDYDSEGFSIYYGHGRIDAGAAVRRALADRAVAAVGDACGQGCATCVTDLVFGDYCSKVCAAVGDCPQGYTCGDSDGGKACLRDAPCAVLPELCNGQDDDGDGQTDETCLPRSCANETTAGRCDGYEAVFCDGGSIVDIDCGALGGTCEIDAASGLARCGFCPEEYPENGLVRSYCSGNIALTCLYTEFFGVRSLVEVGVTPCSERCVDSEGFASCECNEPDLNTCNGNEHVYCNGALSEALTVACTTDCEPIADSPYSHCSCDATATTCDGNSLAACDTTGAVVRAVCPDGCGPSGATQSNDCLCADGATYPGTCTDDNQVRSCVAGSTQIFDCPDTCAPEDISGIDSAVCTCDGVPSEGMCDGNVAVNCNFGFAARTECATGCGRLVGPDGESVQAGCLCEGMDAPIECEGGNILACLTNGDIAKVACAAVFEGTDQCVPVASSDPDELPVECIASGDAEVAEVVEAGPEAGPEEVEAQPEVVTPEATAETVDGDTAVAEAEPKKVKDDGCTGGSAASGLALALGLALLARWLRRSKALLRSRGK